jgi:hypothetical protein
MNVSSSRETQFADEKGLKTAQVIGPNVVATTLQGELRPRFAYVERPYRLRAQCANSCNSALASFRSRVSNPSVNQV